jgi:tetratricopeptide (TPR) repeat protein
MMRHYLRDFHGALKDYQVAILQDSLNSGAYNNSAAAYMILQDFESARKMLDKAIELVPEYAQAIDNRGRVRMKLGDMAGACDDWNKAFSLGITAAKDMIVKHCK